MSILARDVMQRHVVTVTPETTLAELADLLVGKRIGAVPVVQSGAIVGVVSRSDFARTVSLERSLAGLVADAEATQEFAPGEASEPPALPARVEGRIVRDVMVQTPITVAPETPISEVADLLVKHHLHRVFVVEGGVLRGVVGALDIMRLVASGVLRPERPTS